MNYAKTTVDLIRHGEPEGGVKFRGSLDDPLSEDGWLQMSTATAQCNSWDLVVSSPLERCQKFANHLSQQLGKPLEVHRGLREIDFGDWEGKTSQEIEETDAEAVKKFWENPVTNCPPKGEKTADFQNRVLNAWQQVIETHRGNHILLVGHGGSIRVILAEVLNIPLHAMFRLEIPFACVSRISIYHDDKGHFPTLSFHNGIPTDEESKS